MMMSNSTMFCLFTMFALYNRDSMKITLLCEGGNNRKKLLNGYCSNGFLITDQVTLKTKDIF